MLQSRRRRHGSYQLAAVTAGEKNTGWIGALIVLALVVWGAFTLYRAFAPSVSGKRIATVLAVHGEGVRVVIGGEEEQRAESGLRLYDGDAVTTGPDTASLRFFDESTVTLGEGSVVLLEEVIEGEGMSALALRLDRGALLIHASTGAQVLRTIETPLALHSIPPRTRAILVVSAIPETGEEIAVFDSSEQGIETTLRDSGRPPVVVIVGEGQELHATPMAIREVKAGTLHAYDLRSVLSEKHASSPLLSLDVGTVGNVPTEMTTVTESSVEQEGEQLVLLSPHDGAHLAGETVLIEGTVGLRVTSVRVNGYAAEITDGHFTKEIALGTSEEVTIEVQAEDRDGLTVASKTLALTHDIRPPDPPRITSPGSSGSTVSVNEDSFEIVGVASEDTTGIVVNGYQLQKFVTGKEWRYLVDPSIGNVKVGENTYDVHALDRSGNASAPVRITVLWKAEAAPAEDADIPREQRLQPGSLRITAPTNGSRFETSDPEVLIEGETPQDTAALSINGFTLTKYVAGKTTWNYIAKEEYGNYKGGANLYTVVARNAEGKILDMVRYIIERTN